MWTAGRFQVFSTILFVWGLLISLGSEAKVYYGNTANVDVSAPPLPCTQMIHWSQQFSDKQTVVECHSRTNPQFSVTLKTYAPGDFAYFNPYDYDKDSQVWECVARLTFSSVCSRFVAWAALGQEAAVCGGRQSCHQCKWVGVQYDIAMDSEQCMEEDDVTKSNMISSANVNNTTSLGSPQLWYCYEWTHEPC